VVIATKLYLLTDLSEQVAALVRYL